jgi:hypothetical protein
MKVRDVLKLIEDNGWYQVAQKGSHRQFKHPQKIGPSVYYHCQILRVYFNQTDTVAFSVFSGNV